MTARFQPTEHVREEMHRRCQTAGVVFADVRWEPTRECLCIYELWSGDNWQIERELRDEAGEPRQVHEGDIKEIESRMRGKRAEIDNWLVNYKEQKAIMERARKLKLRDLCYDTAREMNRRSIRKTVTRTGGSVRWSDQFPCHHESPMRATCEQCKKEARTTFYMGG